MAKITTSIDVLSGGRAVMGLGAAWAGAEHLAFGFPFPPLKERFERLEEAVQIFRAMFTQDQPSCAGTHDEIREILNRPAPIRGDIPIMIGGSGERKTHRLVAQYADASNLFGDPEEIRHLVGVLNDHCATVGRDPAEITKTRLGGLILRDRHADALAAKAQFLADHPHQTESLVTAGGATAVAEQVQALLDAGPDGLIFSMPEVHDTEEVKAAGRLLCELVT
jgi:alkanesulfonate monooxygenase SsuD/methylene tetrahydromethanopterin reductase-like flavin-dependent oxidoreductase (luciferase family)